MTPRAGQEGDELVAVNDMAVDGMRDIADISRHISGPEVAPPGPRLQLLPPLLLFLHLSHHHLLLQLIVQQQQQQLLPLPLTHARARASNTPKQGTQVTLQVKQGAYIRRVSLVRRALPPPNGNASLSPRPSQALQPSYSPRPAEAPSPSNAAEHLPLSFFQHD